MIDDDEDDYEGYFLRPANEYNIKEKIIQANQESFAIPTPPSPRQHASGERRVTFREQLVDYEPDDYSSEDDGFGGHGHVSGEGGTSGGGVGPAGHRKNAIIETVADVHRDGGEMDGCSGADTIIEELHLDEGRRTTPGQDQEEEEVEEEQLEGDYDEDAEGTDDRMEKHKTGVEGETVVSEEDDDDEVEEETTVHEPEPVEEEEEEEEEEPTDGSSMDTEIHNPESSEDISSSPLKTYRSEADSRSGSGDSQAEETNPGEEDGNEVHYEDDNDDDDDDDDDGERRAATNGENVDSSSDGERPLEAHRAKRSSTCRRKCCRHKKSASEKLPYYNGFRSEYGLSREELEEKKRRLEARRQRVRERQQRRTAEQRQKARSNEEAFAAWLHGKLRNSINKHQNMYDVKQSGSSGRQQQQQQQPLNPKYRRRNGIHTMQQISYG
uniref:Coiled-coil domain-containing protein 181 n=1 Tax=Anopheles epiroticus TaxID=199890 RepID=A0A182PIJ8_9DIPT